jgi:hypothetical protein
VTEAANIFARGMSSLSDEEAARIITLLAEKN